MTDQINRFHLSTQVMAYQGNDNQFLDRLFKRSCGNRKRDNGFKLNKGRFIIDIRKKYFMMRLVTQEQIGQSMLDASFLETIKMLKVYY